VSGDVARAALTERPVLSSSDLARRASAEAVLP